MPQRQQPVTNPRIVKLIELETAGRIRREHLQELQSYRARGLAPKSASLTEAENKSTGFYARAQGANTDFLATEAATQPRSVTAQGLADTLPVGMVNSWTSPDRQKSIQAKEDFIRASLRYESGAAIGKDEFTAQDQIFFPQPGDSPEVIQQKAASRERVIQSLNVSSGAGASRLPQTANAVEPISVDGVIDRALGFRGGTPGTPEKQSDGSIRVRMPDGTFSTYADQATYDRSQAEDLLAEVFGGDRNSEGYRTAYRARFGENAPLIVDVTGGTKPKLVDDGAGSAFVRGLGDGVTFGTLDELGGVADTLLTDKGGSGSFTDRLRRNVSDNRAILAGDAQLHPYARISGQVVGGLALPIGAGARSVGQFTRVGALSGAAYSAGSADGDLGDRAVGALGGAAAGAVGGALAGVAVPRLSSALSTFAQPSARNATIAAERSALGQAAARQDVPLLPADVRPGLRNGTAYLEASPGGSAPVQRAFATGNDATEQALLRVGSSGTARTPEEIGTSVQDAGRRAIAWSRQRKDQLYTQAEQLASGATVQSDNAVQALDQHIAELSQTPNANRGILNLLNDFRDDLVDDTGAIRPLTIGAIRNLRTAMRGEIGTRNLTMTDAERRIGDVIDAASDDITAALQATNPRAADAYRRADAFYRERQTYIGDIIQRFTGPRDRPLAGEKAYQQMVAMAAPGGDRRRLTAMMRGLSSDERADVAATMAGQLGRRAPDAPFSPALFVQQAGRLAPDARVAIFGQEGADAIADLVRIAAAKRDAAGSLNRSRSGQVGNYDRWLGGALGLIGGGAGYAAGGVPGAAVGAAAVAGAKAATLNLSARVLTNPTFASWLARAPATNNPARIANHVQQLGRIAATQPAIRGEITQLQGLLSSSTTSRSFASDGERSESQRTDGNHAGAAVR